SLLVHRSQNAPLMVDPCTRRSHHRLRADAEDVLLRASEADHGKCVERRKPRQLATDYSESRFQNRGTRTSEGNLELAFRIQRLDYDSPERPEYSHRCPAEREAVACSDGGVQRAESRVLRSIAHRQPTSRVWRNANSQSKSKCRTGGISS